MGKPVKHIECVRAPMIEQAINATNWDKTSTWETLASKAAGESCPQKKPQKDPKKK
ncbi:hypothetical protein [Anaerobaca lacustris]|uniref:Uncharacterized protein n=1 Tax=Anaerobaca lacustris TaxID=3044600 RepID=A0AAW6TYF5_9BACT|nr:hypothetical protein [Sedimentisphaerales bacterium M17dextr]